MCQQVTVKKTVSLLILILSLSLVSALAAQSLEEKRTLLKASANYQVPKGQELKLRVIQIPTQLPWIERDIDGKIIPPKVADIIVSQSLEDIEIYSSEQLSGYYSGEAAKSILPAGTKFYAKVQSISPPGKFQKDGRITLNFYKLETAQFNIALDSENESAQLNYTTAEPSFKAKAQKAANVGAYTIGGALAGTLIAYNLAGPIGTLGLVSAGGPYTIAGAAALGATAGLAIGIFKSGDLKALEPGSEINIEPNNSWFISLADSIDQTIESATFTTETPSAETKLIPTLVDISIQKIKKAKSLFGEPCINITFDYINKSNQELRHSSFTLVDSMGKVYEASPRKWEDDLFGELEKEGQLSLCYPVEFTKAIHQLEVRSAYRSKLLANKEIILRK